MYIRSRNIGWVIPFERLVSGAYRLVIEPIAFFRFQGNNIALTAHEAALYDQQLNGTLRNRMTSLSHQNLPLALFLERTDLGIPAFTGTATGTQSNAAILRYLGVGIVSYTDTPAIAPPPSSSFEREYRINTEVITAVTLSTFEEINPNAPAAVTFNVLGRTHTYRRHRPRNGAFIINRVYCLFTHKPVVIFICMVTARRTAGGNRFPTGIRLQPNHRYIRTRLHRRQRH